MYTASITSKNCVNVKTLPRILGLTFKKTAGYDNSRHNKVIHISFSNYSSIYNWATNKSTAWVSQANRLHITKHKYFGSQQINSLEAAFSHWNIVYRCSTKNYFRKLFK